MGNLSAESTRRQGQQHDGQDNRYYDGGKENKLVYPDDPNCTGWTRNYDLMKRIAKDLGVNNIDRDFNFPIGTMYWARNALADLYTKNWQWDDFPPEPIDNDGTILHAIEISYIVKKNGFQERLTFMSFNTLRIS